MAEACTCGHEVEAHGGDPKYPGASACSEKDCDCIAYEQDGFFDDEATDD